MKKIHLVFVWLCAGLLLVSGFLGALVPPPPSQQTASFPALPGLTPLAQNPVAAVSAAPKPVAPQPASTNIIPGLTSITPAPVVIPTPASVVQPQAPLPAPINITPGLTPPATLPASASTNIIPGLAPATPAPVSAAIPTIAPVAQLQAPLPVSTNIIQATAPLPATVLPPVTVQLPAPTTVSGLSPMVIPGPSSVVPSPAPVFGALVQQPATTLLPEVASPLPSVVPAAPAVTAVQGEQVHAVDSVALQAFPEGTRVALLFTGGGNKDARLLKITRGIFVAPIGKNPFDPKCQFKVRRKGNWIGFESDFLKGRTLQSDPANFVVHFPNSNFSDDNHKSAHWSAQFINPRDVTSVVRLQNRATQGFLNFPYEQWAESLAWTAFKEKTPATIAGELARLKMIKVQDLPKEIGTAAGGKNYLFMPRIHKKLTPVYSDGWKFETQGSGYVIFDAQAKESIVVSFSTVADNLADNMYYLVIGDQKNSCTTIRKQIEGSIFYKHVLKKGVDQTGQKKVDKKIDSYWIKVDSGKVSYGTGRDLGQNMLFEWKDPDKPLKVQFVGFAGGNAKVDFKNIEIGGKEKLATAVTLPTGFNQEAGILKRVAVGSRKGILEVWGIGLDRASLWRWKVDSMAANPWEQQKTIATDGSALTSFDDIYLSSNGDLFVISQAKTFRYDWEKLRWNEIDSGMQRLQFNSISGHEGNLWAIAQDGAAYQFVKQSWQRHSDVKSASKVIVSPDNEVFVLNQAGKIFRYKGSNRWVKIPSNASFKEFFVINKELLFAIDRQQNLWQFTPASGFAPVADLKKQRASGFTHGSGNASGTIILVGPQGALYKLRNDGVPEKKIKQIMAQKAPALLSTKAVKVTQKKRLGKKVQKRKTLARKKKKTKKKSQVKPKKSKKKNIKKKM